MLFNPNPTQSQGRISGRPIRPSFTPSQRAGVAAQLIRGERRLTSAQACAVTRANGGYVSIALQATPEQRAELACGYGSIQELRRGRIPANPAAALVRAWNECSNAERVEFANRVGVARVWDECIAPALD
jgi:hypothetical protein